MAQQLAAGQAAVGECAVCTHEGCHAGSASMGRLNSWRTSAQHPPACMACCSGSNLLPDPPAATPRLHTTCYLQVLPALQQRVRRALLHAQGRRLLTNALQGSGLGRLAQGAALGA